MTAVTTRVEPILVSELLTQLVAYEQCVEIKNGGSNTSANVVARDGRGGNSSHGRNSGDRDGGGHGGFGRGGGGRVQNQARDSNF